MDSEAFLGINLTLRICVDFKRYFFRHTLNTGSSLAEDGGEGDLRHPFNTGVGIKRHLKCGIPGLTPVSTLIFKNPCSHLQILILACL